MTNKNLRFIWVILLLTLWGPVLPAPAQTSSEPARERLLNGLSILFWPRSGDPNVTLKLRIHSGAAFDLAGKAGMMALLGDALFPDLETREYVREQLGGHLEVSTDYDAINVTISGNTNELERMIELLRSAVMTPNLSAESVIKLREARIKSLRDGPSGASGTADAAVAARLFRSFPYGSPAPGNIETLGKIDRADLMLAQERFLHADNASLAVIGGVEKPRLMRALRQLLGSWAKSDRTIPSTFRQPAAPDSRVLLINQTPGAAAEVRVAVRGLTRADRDALAASLLARIAQGRWKSAVADLSLPSVRHEAHVLPGMFIFSGRVPTASAVKAVSAAQDIMTTLVTNGATAAELESARLTLIAEASARATAPEGIADEWLDLETYKLPSSATPPSNLERVSVADIQRVAARLFKDAPKATVVLGDADQLKTAFGANVELRSVAVEEKTSIKPPTASPKP